MGFDWDETWRASHQFSTSRENERVQLLMPCGSPTILLHSPSSNGIYTPVVGIRFFHDVELSLNLFATQAAFPDRIRISYPKQ